MKVSIKVALFNSPYHVGWRKPEVLISNTTLLRSIAYLASLLRIDNIVKAIAEGRLISSALFPTIKDNNGRLRLLIPFPPIPSLTKLVRAKWISLLAMKELIKLFDNYGKAPILVSTEHVSRDTYLAKVKCDGIGGKLNLFIMGDVALHEIEKDYVRCKACRGLINSFREVRNRVDRITGSADLFVISGYYAKVPLWFILSYEGVEESVIVKILNLLSNTGLGGFRSRGWGAFRLMNEPKIADEYVKLISEGLNYVGSKYYVTLGTTVLPSNLMDLRRSIIKLGFIEGYAGNSNNTYVLPRLVVILPSSILYLNSNPYTVRPVIRISTQYLDYKPFISLATLFMR